MRWRGGSRSDKIAGDDVTRSGVLDDQEAYGRVLEYIAAASELPTDWYSTDACQIAAKAVAFLQEGALNDGEFLAFLHGWLSARARELAS